jgi:hypothetical protein
MKIKLISVAPCSSDYTKDGYSLGMLLEVELLEPESKGRVTDVNADYVFFKGEYEVVEE